MLAIYEPHVVGSSVSFEWELPSIEEFRQRITDVLQDFPWLVAYDETGIIGYAYATKYRTRLAYQWSVETSVYVRQDQYRQGVGHKLYEALLPILIQQNYTTAFAVIALPNEKSVRFHEAHDFKYLCTYPKVGFKLDSWHDVGWWSLELIPTTGTPESPIPFREIFSNS